MSQDYEITEKIPRRVACSQQPMSSNNDLFFIHGTEGEDVVRGVVCLKWGCGLFEMRVWFV